MNPQKIGRYEIKSELGRGGMATVYKAYDPRFEREVAVKILPREMLHDPQFRVRFEREAKTIAALEHQSIVPVYDLGEEDGQPYFVMRCMTGGSLADMIAKGPLSLKTSVKLFERMSSALDEAHNKGIIHRDLKPGNILFDRGGEPFISDFGIAKITQSQTATVTGGAIVGTPAYISPEQAQGEKVDGRSDVYAMGVILFEMLSGSQPYQATTPMAIVVKHITEPVPHILDVNPALPPAIEAVIEKAMAKNPDDRFSSAGEFYAALSAVADGQSAEEAFKTASTTALRMTAEKTRLAASKTRSAAGKTRIAQPATVQTGKFNIPMPLFIAGGLIGLCLVAVVLMGVLSICPPEGFLPLPPWCAGSTISWPFSAPPTQVAVVLTNTPLPPATEIPVVVIPPTVSATEVPTEVPATPTETPAPVVASSPGGADKVAFISGKEVWLMNIDGSNLKVLTNDQYPKSNLQWIPGTNTLVFISSTNVNTVNADNGEFNTILSFPFAKTVDEFRVSPDAKQVAISLNREMYVVPFDLALLKQAHGKDGLIAMKGCLNYTGSTQAAILLKDFRWSKDSKTAAWLFEGVNASGKSTDTIRVVDISTCNPSKLTLLDEFPGTRFTPDGFGDRPILPDFDWDGGYLFLMNTFDRNSGWGYLYTYTRELHKGTLETPISGTKTRCCYRDARWSPDGSYIFFAYQNKDAAAAPVQFYYIPVSAIRDGSAQTPIPMPDDFFKNPKEAPQPALHSAQP